ncbi:MAG: TetR/AcrR family transcriptional regulator [Acidimicrobiales bacterium]
MTHQQRWEWIGVCRPGNHTSGEREGAVRGLVHDVGAYLSGDDARNRVGNSPGSATASPVSRAMAAKVDGTTVVDGVDPRDEVVQVDVGTEWGANGIWVGLMKGNMDGRTTDAMSSPYSFRRSAAPYAPQSMVPRRTQVERSRATRTALLGAARALFAEHGFSSTGREQIAERAGVTRGALYHHFGTKGELFAAVVEELEEEIAAQVVAAGLEAADPADALRRGCLAFLDACLDPAVRRIVLLEAPAVLGWERWREMDERFGLALVSHGLQAAMDAARLDRVPIDPLAHMLLGALNEAALAVATATKPRVARRDVGAAVELVLDRLLRPT